MAKATPATTAQPEASALDLLRTASRQAQADGGHSAHAAFEEALFALHAAKSKVDAAAAHASDDLLGLLQRLQSII
jgi:hypothetical protein